MENEITNDVEETKKNDKYGWIDDGIEELKEGDIDIILHPTVRISTAHFEELVKAETTLEILCRVLEDDQPYNIKKLRTIYGAKYITELVAKDGAKIEPKSE